MIIRFLLEVNSVERAFFICGDIFTCFFSFLLISGCEWPIFPFHYLYYFSFFGFERIFLV